MAPRLETQEGFGRRYCVFGIDPGLDGAVAIYDPIKKELVTVWSTPTEVIISGRYKQRYVDIDKFAIALQEAVAEYGCAAVVMEDVHSSPQMGVASAFKFGDTFGITRALAHVFGSEVIYVSPQKWKARMGVTGSKIMSIEKARATFPKSPFFKLKSKDGLAEAALLAYYGAKDLVVLPELTAEPEEVDPLA